MLASDSPLGTSGFSPYSRKIDVTDAVENREKQVHELAPAWKRYTFATGFAAVAIGATAWGALAPARFVQIISHTLPH